MSFLFFCSNVSTYSARVEARAYFYVLIPALSILESTCVCVCVWSNYRLWLSSANLGALLFMMGMLLMHKNSLAELARSRASHNSGTSVASMPSQATTRLSQQPTRGIKDKMVDKLGAPCFLDSDDLMVSEWLATGDSRK